MPKIAEGKRQICVDVSADVAEHIKRQPYQARYVEELVRRDMGLDDVSNRLALLETTIHQNHIVIDGLDYPMKGQRYSHNENEILSFAFDVRDQPLLGFELSSMADGDTVRSFAFRNEQGLYAGRAKLEPHPQWPYGFKLLIETISRIGDRLYSSADLPEELAINDERYALEARLHRIELAFAKILEGETPKAAIEAVFAEQGFPTKLLVDIFPRK